MCGILHFSANRKCLLPSFPSRYTGQLSFSLSDASPQSSLLITLSSPLFTFTRGSFILYLHIYSVAPPLPRLCIHSASYSIYPRILTIFPCGTKYLASPPDFPLHPEFPCIQLFSLSCSRKSSSRI